MSDDSESNGSTVLSRLPIRTLLVIAILCTVAVGPAAAQDCTDSDCEEELQNQMNEVGSFLSVIIAAVAIPNGAFGVFQWMTAGTDTEQSDKGRKRIRNSFIGVAGAGVIMIAVRLLTNTLGIGA